jgi:hypothetical protein
MGGFMYAYPNYSCCYEFWVIVCNLIYKSVDLYFSYVNDCEGYGEVEKIEVVLLDCCCFVWVRGEGVFDFLMNIGEDFLGLWIFDKY